MCQTVLSYAGEAATDMQQRWYIQLIIFSSFIFNMVVKMHLNVMVKRISYISNYIVRSYRA